MFLFRKPRDRAIGLVAAYALLVAGVVVSADFDAAPVELEDAKKAGEKSPAREIALRCDPVC
jgi:hypothetical protein